VKVQRRRIRKRDPIASVNGVSRIIDKLKNRSPHLLSLTNQQLRSVLQSALHVQRYPATDTKRGRSSQWERGRLLEIAALLRDTLDRETSGRISLSTFVNHYLKILDFPIDIVEALERGDINLFEAEHLARLTPKQLGCSSDLAAKQRATLLSSHLQARLSGDGLRQRVNEMLRPQKKTGEVPKGTGTVNADMSIEEGVDPTHLFYDHISMLVTTLKEIKPEDISELLLEETLDQCDKLWGVIFKIKKHKEQVEKAKQKRAKIAI
jgi:hypothetical protein